MQTAEEELEAAHVAIEAKKCDLDAVNFEITSQLDDIRSEKAELQGMYFALEEAKLGLDTETADLTSKLHSARSEEERLCAEREDWRSEYGAMQAEKELEAEHVALEAKMCDLDAVNSVMASQLDDIRSEKDVEIR